MKKIFLLLFVPFIMNAQIDLYGIEPSQKTSYNFPNEINLLETELRMSSNNIQMIEQYSNDIKKHNEAIYKIIDSINSYLKTKNIKTIENAQNIANKQRLEVFGKVDSKDKYNRKLLLYKPFSKPNKKEIEVYKFELSKQFKEFKQPTIYYDKQKKIDSLKQLTTTTDIFVVNDTIQLTSENVVFVDTLKYYVLYRGNREYIKNEITVGFPNTNTFNGAFSKVSVDGEEYLALKHKIHEYLYNIQLTKGIDEYLSDYNIIKRGDYGAIETKNYILNVGLWLVDEVKDDKNFIKTFDVRMNNLTNTYSQLNKTTQKLDYYIRLYRIQKHDMSKVDIDNWVSETQKAKSELKKLEQLHDEFSVYSYIYKHDNKLDYFLNSLNYSVIVLGL